ncbi:hypoxia up-regulated protein 1 [Tribolium castaneum]|uniref:Hypoxia up-regulated protein 1 n=1 Tax=Tribolium castaneum TaxID=7070 RepID=D2A1Y3_TRICA|nr:PREDICTED: hypoxia up-regulated protein 1 [Tribolium castaneum]EFA02143.1 Hypoxia up-regulated protein 1-like Protein [Tribolium castaneum]|eukprot:XP_973490.1 PREDICTED: hypoxia up-regulated protein 1 [Tribolium castaneum]
MRLIFAILSTLLALATVCESLAVMSVDLGSEWMKIGIVSPGVPMEIALNKESKRKSPAVISFRDNVRSFGEEAQTIGTRFPKNAYMYLLDLLGKSINHPLVKLYKERFPYYEIVEDPERNTILFKHDDNVFYSPEELIAQLLGKAKEFAEQGARQPIKECVLTVPGYFNQIERKSLLQAANLAGLKVLQLINDYTAVALNYGIFRSKDFNETAQYVMFYDMGATSTTATLVSYQTVKTKDKGFVETHPQLSVIGVGFDRTLGGLEIQLRLRDHLARKFNEMKKTKNDVFANARSMAKLFKEAGRVKNILSANAEHYAQIEGLLDEEDFKVLVTRDELEQLAGDLFERVGRPVELALQSAHLTKDIIGQVVLVGAGTRVPKVQEKLQGVVGQDLAKNLNTDEAATMGAVYKAADLSTGFQVKKFLTRDAVLYPIQVVFERETPEGVKQVKRTLFSLMNPYPQKKIITFNKYNDDFNFEVNYADLDYLPPNEIANVGQVNLTEVSLVGVAEALKKNSGENVETKGIKAHFSMDESGILNLVNVELVVEKTVSETDEEGTFSKLGNTISKLFGGEEKTETGEEPVKNDTEPQKNTTVPKPEIKPKVITVKEPITTKQKPLTITPLSKKQFDDSLEKLSKLDKVEKELNRRATALNNLESFVIEVQNKLDEDDFVASASQDEVETIRKSCSEVSDWLYEDGSDADADTYEKKLDGLKTLTSDLFKRVWEHNERPEALNALNTMLNQSSQFLTVAKNLTKSTNPERDVFTDGEVEALEKIIKETEEWKSKMIEEQNKLKKYESVKLTVKSITEKMGAIDREVKYLVNKHRLWRPKKVEKKEESKQEETVEAPGNTTTESAPEDIKPTESEKDTHTEL